ncbi:hypothetical protein J1614_011400 [Plenodomus biglobosus]|nr:hypothetical protein J1614_011400 [Plenodomus biglobosus]
MGTGKGVIDGGVEGELEQAWLRAAARERKQSRREKKAGSPEAPDVYLLGAPWFQPAASGLDEP